ncbi:hypothetical protein OJ967_21395 [Peribacillus frigoritolerans]|uniref:hypothetical protein n=1 Tax=Peribacillus frigoritolerans TaxID=450367 RepID=UPI00222779E8|nr:hypothetical protein [Peribacillus frigoritolerans]UYY97940.1 hypothetical protein OJ967_21395 [Peribacillus frigoritolerans]
MMIAETVISPLLKVADSTVAVNTTGSAFRHGLCFCKQGSLTNKIDDTDIIDSAETKQ